MATITGGLIIDQITKTSSAASPTSMTINHQVSSADAVLVIGVFMQSNVTLPSVAIQVNGSFIPVINTSKDANNNAVAIAYMNNPPVGSVTIVATYTNPPPVAQLFAMSILGADKRQQTPNTFSNVNASSANPNITPFSNATANSMAIDFFYVDAANTTMNPSEPQLLISHSVPSAGITWGVSYKIVPVGNQVMSWTSATLNSVQTLGIIIEPAQAASIWFPNLDNRNSGDLVGRMSGNSGGATPDGWYGNLASNFYLNSFLHTVGRVLGPPTQASPAAETEQQTSQIIIDKVYQRQSSAGAVLTMDINIPSPDAYLLITGGSVIATGGAWVSVKFNGNDATKLIAQNTTGADAEIWAVPFPAVGVYQLSITPTATFGQAYVNAMVLLGVDKRSVSVQSVAVSDAAATTKISTLITPDAPNSLIINVLSTLNALATPVPDESQNQVFNATPINANEYIVVGFQMGSTANILEYNLGAAVNASLVGVSLRPANAMSLWFPSVDTKTLDGPVNVNALDSGKNPASGSYGYFPSNFYLNSFLHTVGRQNTGFAVPSAVVKSNTLLLLGVG